MTVLVYTPIFDQLLAERRPLLDAAELAVIEAKAMALSVTGGPL